MKKKFILILNLFLFYFNIYGNNNKNIQLILSFIDICNFEKKENISFSIFYKGFEYLINIKDGICGQLNIEESEIIQNFFIIISPSIEKVKSISSENLLKGLRISKNVNSACFEISLKITKINDLTSYIWIINKIDSPENCLPENSIIICADPSVINIVPFENKFCPLYQEINENNNNRIVFLPQIYINSEAFKKKQYETCQLNIKEVHVKK